MDLNSFEPESRQVPARADGIFFFGQPAEMPEGWVAPENGASEFREV